MTITALPHATPTRQAPPKLYPVTGFPETDFQAALVAGGDPRLDLDPATGCNAYGVGPGPDLEILAFASTTANTISPAAYASTRALYDAIARDPRPDRLAQPYHILIETIRQLAGAPPETAILPLASGTDGVLYASWLCSALLPLRPLHVILTGGIESGSGVPLAARGRHYATRTPQGLAVIKGSHALPTMPDITLEDIAMRDPAGLPVPLDLLADAIERAVTVAIGAGRRVLLHHMAGSKTGLIGPGFTALDHLARRFGEDFCVLVDACQMRCDKTLLQDHLRRGHLALITGSKFLGGPPFSGALLVPHPRRPLPALPGYGGPEPDNPGLLLRWHAALSQWRRYAALPPAVAAALVARFEALVIHSFAQGGAAASSAIRLLAPGGSGGSARTILPFTLERLGAIMGMADAQRIHQALMRPHPSAPERIHLGQAVALRPDGSHAALRIGLDARMITLFADPRCAERAWAHTADALERLIAKLHWLLA